LRKTDCAGDGPRHRCCAPSPVNRGADNFFLYRYAGSYQNELNQFIAALQAGIPPSPRIADGLAAQLLVQAIVDSIATQQPVQVNL
jgi:myo-inositol 2-dehydrogenase/D-chiro-inositol 1-dehydrogenase